MERDEDQPVGGGCCGWWRNRQRHKGRDGGSSMQRKYAAPPSPHQQKQQVQEVEVALTARKSQPIDVATAGRDGSVGEDGNTAAETDAVLAAPTQPAPCEPAGAAVVEAIVPPLRPGSAADEVDGPTDDANDGGEHEGLRAAAPPLSDSCAAAGAGAMVAAASSAPVQPAPSSPAPAQPPSHLCAQWSRAVDLLRDVCGVADSGQGDAARVHARGAGLRSPVLDAWVKEQGFAPIHSALLALAAAAASAETAGRAGRLLSPTSQGGCNPSRSCSESRGPSLVRQGSSERYPTERGGGLGVAAGGILLSSLGSGGGSPPATSRWTRRLEARTRREHEASVVAAAQQQLALTTRLLEQQAHAQAHANANANGHQAAVLDRAHSHEYSRRSSLSRTHTGTGTLALEPLDEDEVGTGTGAGTGAATYRRYSSKRPLAVPAESPAASRSVWSLPLDLSSAQELNQRQQMLQQLLHDSGAHAGAAAAATATATAPSSSPSSSPAAPSPSPSPPGAPTPTFLQAHPGGDEQEEGEFRGLVDLARGLGQQLVMSHLAEMGAAIPPAERVRDHLSTGPQEDDERHRTTLVSPHGAIGADEIGATATATATGAPAPVPVLVHPVDVAAWVGSLVLILRQLCSSPCSPSASTSAPTLPATTPALGDVALELQKFLLPSLASTGAGPQILPSAHLADDTPLRSHLLHLMELTVPLLAMYASGDASVLPSGFTDDGGHGAPLLPPAAWVASQCCPSCAGALVPLSLSLTPSSSPSAAPALPALVRLEHEVRATVQALCYPHVHAHAHAHVPIGSVPVQQLPMGAAVRALRNLGTALGWILQALQESSAASPSCDTERAALQSLVLRLHPFLLHSLLDLFWSRLCMGEGAGADAGADLACVQQRPGEEGAAPAPAAAANAAALAAREARMAWTAWGGCVRSICATVDWLCREAGVVAGVASSDTALRASEAQLCSLHAALKDESTTSLLPLPLPPPGAGVPPVGGAGPVVVVSVPPLVQLVTATVSLLFDPIAFPPECVDSDGDDEATDDASSSLSPSSLSSFDDIDGEEELHGVQMAALGCIDSCCRLASTAAFLRLQLHDASVSVGAGVEAGAGAGAGAGQNDPAGSGLVPAPSPVPAHGGAASRANGADSPLLQLSWFWDAILALFAPSTGCLWEVLSASGGAHDGLEGEAEPRPSLPMQRLLCSFMADMVFSPAVAASTSAGAASAPLLPCPWLLDGTFVAAYLQCHYAALLRYYHAPANANAGASAKASEAEWEALALAHLSVLRAAAQIPCALSLRLRAVPSTGPVLTPPTPSQAQAQAQAHPPPTQTLVVPLAHVHFQLYHLGIVAWLASQISLEMDLGETGTATATAAANAGPSGGEATGVHEEAQGQDQAPEELPVTNRNHDGGDQEPLEGDQSGPDAGGNDVHVHRSRSGSGSGRGSRSGSDGSTDFSDINFDDSDEDAFYASPAPPAVASAGAGAGLFAPPKLRIAQQGGRHINEQFALGWDGMPLHPEPELELEHTQHFDGEQQQEQEQHHEIGEEQQDVAATTALAPDGAQGDAAREGSEGEEDGESLSGSGSDLGDEGWGDSAESLQPTPRAPGPVAVAGLLIPPLLAGAAAVAQDKEVPQQQHDDGDCAEAAAVHVSSPAAPVGIPALCASAASSPPPCASRSSYASLRGRHLLYRSEALHAALVELLLHLCLDPAAPQGAGLNALYCQRFPLQASGEQQRMDDAAQVQRAAQEEAAAAAAAAAAPARSAGADSSLSSSSFDDLGGVAAAATGDALVPLGVNLLFALHLHVNHPSNSYLCPLLLRSLDAAAPLQVLGGCFAGRERSLRRLIKLLFEQLFSPAQYQYRSQIGRGRFASVYAASYVPASLSRAALPQQQAQQAQRVALKQVEQPSSVHDQVALVDLFTEISILDMLAQDSRAAAAAAAAAAVASADPDADAGDGVDAAASVAPLPSRVLPRAPCVEVLDFGVGDGCFWIVMPLAQCSLKAFKQRQAETTPAATATAREGGGDEAGPRAREQRRQEQALIRSFLADLVEPSCLPPLLALLSDSDPNRLPARVRARSRRILSSLALYSAVLDCCAKMQRHDVVHFDIKADNFLVLIDDEQRQRQGAGAATEAGITAEASADDADNSATALDAPCFVRVALADFGEALLVPSAHSVSLAHCGLAAGGGGGSRISRGTENIQSPEMLTLIRALDRTDVSHDRRRKAAADFGSDVWAIGAAFYEIVMHVYADASTVHGGDRGDVSGGGAEEEDTGMSGSGLLFEEAAGLPIFLQVTSPALPLLSECKRAALARPGALGEPLLSLCESFLSFVLRRDRRHRPGLAQVVAKFRSTALDMVCTLLAPPLSGTTGSGARAIHPRRLHAARLHRGDARSGSIGVSWPPLQPSPLAQAPYHQQHHDGAPAPSPELSCTCSPPPAGWFGLAPPFRCALCALRASDGPVAPGDLRSLFARRSSHASALGSTGVSAAAQHSLRGMVAVIWHPSYGSVRVLDLSPSSAAFPLPLVEAVPAHWASAPPPLLLAYDPCAGVDRALLDLLVSRRVFFLPLPLPSALPAADSNATPASTALVIAPDLVQSAREFVRRSRPPLLLVGAADRASDLFALLVQLDQTLACVSPRTAIEHAATLHSAATALLALPRA